MSFFEKSDLFFVCMLRPLSFEIQKQESEIEAAQVIHNCCSKFISSNKIIIVIVFELEKHI